MRALPDPVRFLSLAATAALLLGGLAPAQRDLSKDKVLYCVGYAHLDTQWRWDYPETIGKFLKATLDDNFERFEKHPGYVFNFTGTHRYALMKEYYPERWEKLKRYVAEGRWRVAGSSVDECDVNSPCAESIVRQILYGNEFFRAEFGKESADFMLPDCFGFPASIPSILAHCGILGFSTQKLSWGSAVGVPFGLGVWEGPDGAGVLAGLNPGSYASAIKGRVDRNEAWAKRIQENGDRYGVFADFHYYGVGDVGGAPREEDVVNYLASVDQKDSLFHVELASSDQLFRDLSPAQKERLPRYKGDLLLTQHSAGSLTSEAAMKRWNRKNECLADAAERASVAAAWLGAAEYPRDLLHRSWIQMLGSQMHDMLPGTALPRAYGFAWNDEITALNGFAAAFTDATAGIARGLDTQVEGVPLVVVNPLAIEREDPVEANMAFAGVAPPSVRVVAPDGADVPVQVLERAENRLRLLLLPKVGPVSWTVLDVRRADQAAAESAVLHVDERSLENEDYRVEIDENGDVKSVRDKKDGGRELLSGPARLVLTHEKPQQWPAWNMDWSDRQKPPVGAFEKPAETKVVERGPVRVALEIRRTTHDSTAVQTLRLSRGTAGRRLEFASRIDWQAAGVALRASFPVTVASAEATYNLGLGTIRRATNDPKKYEVPSHEWIDLTDDAGAYGVSILDDCKTGSDKPSERELRLTLLYSPGVGKAYADQHSQDWGRHDVLYALYGHKGDWRDGRTEWQGRRLNQPLRVVQPTRHAGTVGRSLELLRASTDQVDVRAIKQAEAGDEVVVRVAELFGRDAKNVEIALAGGVLDAREVDGQERPIGKATVRDGRLVLDLRPFQPRAFALKLAPPKSRLGPVSGEPVALAFDGDVVGARERAGDGSFGADGRSIPAETFPDRLRFGGIEYALGSGAAGAKNALACRGQSIDLPHGEFDEIRFLAAADETVRASFRLGDKESTVEVPCWTGVVGRWDQRVWEGKNDPDPDSGEGHVVAFEPGFIQRAPIAWFCTHRHDRDGKDEPYRYSYLFERRLDRPNGAEKLVLPNDPRIKLLALCAVRRASGGAVPCAPLYDDYTDRGPLAVRHVYPPPPEPVHAGRTAIGAVASERAASFEKLSLPRPSKTDFADASAGHGVVFHVFDGDGTYTPHPRSGAVGDTLPRLNDGEVAQNEDDTRRCVWYDGEGRFYADLAKSTPVAAVRTFSWHRANRAPQRFSLWGSNAEKLPDPGFQHGEGKDWTLLGVVDTSKLGDGGVHASVVSAKDGQASSGPTNIGTFRYLLWICEDVGEGTFFTEIDVDAAK
jgi:alpha-mannosidase